MKSEVMAMTKACGTKPTVPEERSGWMLSRWHSSTWLTHCPLWGFPSRGAALVDTEVLVSAHAADLPGFSIFDMCK